MVRKIPLKVRASLLLFIVLIYPFFVIALYNYNFSPFYSGDHYWLTLVAHTIVSFIFIVLGSSVRDDYKEWKSNRNDEI